MMLKSYSTAGITQGVPHGGCPGGFTRLLCSEKDWRIMQPMNTKLDDESGQLRQKSNDAFISWIVVGNERAIFHET